MTGPRSGYEPLVSESRFDLKLRAMAGVEGAAVIRRALDLAGLVTLESDRPEWMLSGGERLAGGQFFSVGGAATLGIAILYNPEGSGILGIVLRAHGRSTLVNNDVLFRIYRGTQANLTAAGFTANATAVLDTRNRTVGAVGATTLQVLDVAAGVAGPPVGTEAAFDDFFSASASTVEFDSTQPIVLAPGTGLVVQVSIVGVGTLVGAYRWREGLLF